MHAMFSLSALCDPAGAVRLREYADEKYFEYRDKVGY
jgi:hypothetical protein